MLCGELVNVSCASLQKSVFGQKCVSRGANVSMITCTQAAQVNASTHGCTALQAGLAVFVVFIKLLSYVSSLGKR